jgi:hypothetical protein
VLFDEAGQWNWE